MLKLAPITTVLLLCAACATTAPPRPAEQPDGATLEVANRTTLDFEISVNGWTVGLVRSGSRARFRHLSPGEARLTALSPGYQLKETALTLARASTSTWELIPPPDTGRALTSPPEFGTITLANQTKKDLEFTVDGGPPRTLLGGEERTVRDISAGERVVLWTVPGTLYRRAVTVAVPPGGVIRIPAALEVGTLSIVNQTGEVVRLFIDGIEQQRVSNGATELLESVLVGVHRLRGVGEDTGKEHFWTIHMDDRGALTWDLSDTSGRLSLHNHTGETLKLTIDGKESGALEPGKTLEFKELALGVREVAAAGQTSSYRWTAEIPIRTGHTSVWRLRSDRGTLRVENRLTEAVTVHVQGEVRGSVEPGGSLFLDTLPMEALRVDVQGDVSKALRRRQLTPSAGASVVWLVTEPEATLHVRNKLTEEVMVFADGHPLGRVGADAELIFTQVPPGERILEAIGQTSGHKIVTRQTVSAATLLVWDVAQSAGTVTVENRSGEALQLPPQYRSQAETIPTGRTLTLQLPVGHRMVHFIGATSGVSYFKRIWIRDSVPAHWLIGEQVGIVHVYNKTGEAQVVRVGTKEVLTVPPRSDRTLRLSVGAHQLVAVGADSKEAQNGTVVIRSKVVQPWEIRGRVGSLRILNQTEETLELRRDGGVLGRVAKGASTRFGPWPPGKYRLTAQGSWSHAIYERHIDVRAGRIEVWDVLPARGALLLVNERNEEIRILLDREAVGTVPANGKLRMEVPLGSHLVELIGVETREPFTHRVRVRPDRTYTLAAAAGPGQLRIKNELPFALQIQVDLMDRGSVEAGGEAVIPLTGRGHFTVHAIGPGGKVRWHRRIRLDVDRELKWVIRKP